MAQRPWLQLAYVLGEALLTLLSGGALFVVISRVAGPETLGAYALATAWLMLFHAIASVGIPEFLMREVGAHGRGAGEQVTHAMAIGLASALVFDALMLGAVRVLGYAPVVVEAISIVSLALIPAFLNIACRSVFLAFRLMHLTFFALLAEAAIVMSSSVYLLLHGYGVISLMVVMVIAKIVSASLSLAMLLYGVRLAPAPLRLGALRRTTKTLAVFGIGNALGMFTMRVNTIMVSLFVNIVSVGHFAAATKLMEVSMIIPNLISQLLLTRIAYNFRLQTNNDPNRYAAWFEFEFAFVLPTCVGAWIFATPILQFLFGPSFGAAHWVFRILMLYLVIESMDSLMSVILKAAHRQREDVIRLSFNPLVNVLLNLALLPLIGDIGAAIGRVGGVGASAVLRDLLIARKLKQVHWLRYAWKPALISAGTGALCYAWLDESHPFWPLALYVCATPLLLWLLAGLTPATVKEMVSFSNANPTQAEAE